MSYYLRPLLMFPAESSLKDGLFHEYKKHGKVLGVKVFGQGSDRYAVVTFKKPEDAEKALQVSQDKQFFGCRIEVKLHEGLGKFPRRRLLSFYLGACARVCTRSSIWF